MVRDRGASLSDALDASPDRYVKEIRLWIERTREREIEREKGREEGREQYGVCVMSDPFTGFGEDGANRVVGIVI